jgi:hypothetical protein
MTITFANPVAGAGAQIQSNDYQTFTGTLKVYDTSSTLIGTFSAVGTSTHTADNSAQFLGVKDTTADIGSIEYSTVSVSNTNNNNFGINRLDLITPVPEPSTLAFLVSGLPIFVVAMRMRARKTTHSASLPSIF